jgi:hypothetical protein
VSAIYILIMEETASIHVLDIGDHWVLATNPVNLERDYLAHGIMKRAVRLYNDMNVTVFTTKLDNVVDVADCEYIQSICGHIIPKSNGIDVPKMLNSDITEILKFKKIKERWTVINQHTHSIKQTAYVPLYKGDDAILHKVEGYDGHGIYAMHCIDVKPVEAYRSPTSNVVSYVIIYNDITHISLITYDDTANLHAMCNEFTEFVIVYKILTESKTQIEEFKKHFHKKVFQNITEIKGKLESFKTFHDIIDSKPDFVSIKTLVFQCLDQMYTIDASSDDEIAESDLLHKIASVVLIDDRRVLLPINTQQLIGYCFEYGLLRKRSSDGNYYYRGITYKFKDKPILSPELIEKKRIEEMKDFQ